MSERGAVTLVLALAILNGRGGGGGVRGNGPEWEQPTRFRVTPPIAVCPLFGQFRGYTGTREQKEAYKTT